MTSRTLRTLAIAATALVAASAVSACGEDSSASAGGEAASIRLGYFPNITHAPALVGVKNGIFTAELGATKLEPKAFNAGPAALEALLSGAVDATYVGPNPAINGWAQTKGKGLKIIAGTTSGGAALVELVRGLDRADIVVSGIESRRPSLDDVFLGLTGRSLRDAESAPPVPEKVTV